MVKKLLKQEYKYYIRTLIFVFPAVLLLGLFTRIIQIFEVDHYLYNIAFGGTVIILVISSIACVIASEILAIVRFYKNLYSTEGYLTFTLPVNNHQHLISKLIAHILCNIVSAFVVFLAWMIAFANFEIVNNIFVGLETLLSLIDVSSNLIHIIFYFIEFIIILIISIVCKPLIYYSCISIGQLAKKNRILLAIGVYYLYGVIVNIFGTILTMLFSIVGLSGGFDWIIPLFEAHPLAFIHIVLWIVIVVFLGVTAFMYYINVYIMTKKLNLE